MARPQVQNECGSRTSRSQIQQSRLPFTQDRKATARIGLASR
jgi:hypothetical protein